MNLRAALVCVFALAACTDNAPPESDQSAAPTGKASRVVTLAPHLAELVFAAGAGSSLVGVSAYTDYPPEAAKLPVISDAFTVDQEQLRLLKPDLVLAWASGMPESTIEELRGTGLNVVTIDTRSTGDIAAALFRIGELTGQKKAAVEEVKRFKFGLSQLAHQYARKQRIRVFYQVSSRPLYTVNGKHFISELISGCGGNNVFRELDELAPAVDVEAVLAREPEVIVSMGPAESLEIWDRFDTLPANVYGNRIIIESKHLARASTRLDSAARELCEKLDEARERLPARPNQGSPETTMTIEKLDRIVSHVLAMNDEPRIAPGLERSEIVEKLERASIPATDELISLYEWHNGIVYLNAFLSFYDLDFAIEIYEGTRDHQSEVPEYGWREGMFPVLTMNGDIYYYVDLGTGAVFAGDIEDGAFRKMADHYDQVLDAVLGAFEQKLVTFNDRGGAIEIEYEDWRALGEQFDVSTEFTPADRQY